MVPKSISWTIGGGPISDASAPSDPPNSVDPTQDKDQDVPLPVPSSPADGQEPAVVPLGDDMEGVRIRIKIKITIRIVSWLKGTRKLPLGNQKGSDHLTKNSFLQSNQPIRK